jgi:hypothetical protein
MFQADAPRQERSAISRVLGAAGTWLTYMGIFAGLLWLSAQRQEGRSAAEKPMETAREASPSHCPKRAESPSPVDFDPRCGLFAHNEVIPFSPGIMTQPKLISGEELRHTPEALAAQVEGLIVARCTLTCMGEVKHCRILKGLPHMNQVTLAVLESRRYHPVRYLGRPMNVSYNFHVKLKRSKDEPASLSPCGLDSDRT